MTRKKDNRKYREQQRGYHLRVRYGLSVDAYESMLRGQSEVCALCLQPPKKNRLHVDHCHETGAVRGLLCTSCNTTLGKLDNMPGGLKAVEDYLSATIEPD